MNILIIDDEAHIRQMMRMTLESSGVVVAEADSAAAGLARFGDGHAFDVVILDQKMPGTDGLTTLERLKERRPDARVLMVTAFASIELAVAAMKLGASDFLRKPMTPQTLRGAVVAAANRPQPARARVASSGAAGRPVTHTMTLNGFQISSPSGASAAPASREHVFTVKHYASASESTVAVAIAPEAVDRVRRLTGRSLEPDGAFFRLQAERLLAAYVWSEGQPPADGRLTLRDVARDDIDIALAWEAD